MKEHQAKLSAIIEQIEGSRKAKEKQVECLRSELQQLKEKCEEQEQLLAKLKELEEAKKSLSMVSQKLEQKEAELQERTEETKKILQERDSFVSSYRKLELQHKNALVENENLLNSLHRFPFSLSLLSFFQRQPWQLVDI